MEDWDPKKDKFSKQHPKRGSLSSLGAGTKNILAGKFGDAFKRFEANTTGPPQPRTPSPLKDLEHHDRHTLTPIAGSEAVDGRSDDGQSPEWEDMTPEMRREQEARMLAQEEARVAAAQAEYRQRVGQRTGGAGGGGPPVPPPKSIGGVSRVASIQNKVQSLIDESNRASTTVTRTAQGYGHYSDAAATAAAPPNPSEGAPNKPAVPRKPTGGQLTGGQQQPPQPPRPSPTIGMDPSANATSRTMASTTTGSSRPPAPPKPTHLNKPLPVGGGRPPSPTKMTPLMPDLSANARGISSPKLRGPASTTNAVSAGSSNGGGSGLGIGSGSGSGSEALLAVDLPGGQGSALLRMTAAEKDDYVRDFQKRFPSLGAIEMVERDLAAEEGAAARNR
jgi:AP2-associated kinase